MSTTTQTAVDMLRIADNVLRVAMQLVSPELRLDIGRNRIELGDFIDRAKSETARKETVTA